MTMRNRAFLISLFGLLLSATATFAHEVADSPHRSTAAPLLLAQSGVRTPASIQTSLDDLIKSAKAEGELTFYSVATDNVLGNVTKSFTAKYGIKAAYIRLSSGPLLQRFATEAEAGTFSVDMVILAGPNVAIFAADGAKKGWVEPILQAGIPATMSGEYPQKYNRGASTVISIGSWLFAYNTETVKGADIPRDWGDLVNPKWKGKVLLVDPKSSDVYPGFWIMILDRYGEKFFDALRAQNLRTAGSLATFQALAAGEGAIALPTVEYIVLELKTKGAPINSITPAYTSGVEMEMFLTASRRAKHPNAARLMAHYLMSREGNKVFNDAPGVNSIYDTDRLPKEYQAVRSDALLRKDSVYKLLGTN